MEATKSEKVTGIRMRLPQQWFYAKTGRHMQPWSYREEATKSKAGRLTRQGRINLI
jgi:hypothetical protein